MWASSEKFAFSFIFLPVLPSKFTTSPPSFHIGLREQLMMRWRGLSVSLSVCRASFIDLCLFSSDAPVSLRDLHATIDSYILAWVHEATHIWWLIVRSTFHICASKWAARRPACKQPVRLWSKLIYSSQQAARFYTYNQEQRLRKCCKNILFWL